MLSGRIIQNLHFVGVELEEAGDDFGFGRAVRKVVGGQYGAGTSKALYFRALLHGKEMLSYRCSQRRMP